MDLCKVRFVMIQEITQSHYCGVLCSRCEERIPVPKRSAELYEELKHGEVSVDQDAKSRAFTLRCKVCNEEGVYGLKGFTNSRDNHEPEPRILDESARRREQS